MDSMTVEKIYIGPRLPSIIKAMDPVSRVIGYYRFKDAMFIESEIPVITLNH